MYNYKTVRVQEHLQSAVLTPAVARELGVDIVKGHSHVIRIPEIFSRLVNKAIQKPTPPQSLESKS